MKNRIITLLRRSEAYTKTDMVYLVGQGSWLLFGQGAVFLSSLILAWVFANHITPSDYGLYKYVLSIGTIATLTTLTGFSLPIARSVAQNLPLSLKKITSLQIRYGLFGFIGMAGAALYYLYIGNILLASLFAAASVWIPLYEPLSNYQYFLQGKQAFRLQTVLRIIQRLLLTIGVIITIFLTQNIIIVTFFYFLLYTLSHYVLYTYTQKIYPPGDDTNVPYAEIISFGKKISLQNFFHIGASQLDKVLMFAFLGPAQLAIYLFAIALPNELQTALSNINSVAFPKLVDKKTKAFKVALIKKIGTFMLLLTVPVCAYILAAPFIFNLLFPAYIDSIHISQLYAGVALFTPINILWLYFYAIGNERALWFGTFIVPSTFILGICVFVPIFGITGAVMATYVKGVVDASIAIYFFFKKSPTTDL